MRTPVPAPTTDSAPQGTSFRSSAKKSASPSPPPSFQADSKGIYEIRVDSLAMYDCPFNTRVAPKIPVAIQELDGKNVRVKGFMVPFKVNGTRVQSFALVKNQLACCYGVALRPNEWILVRMPEDRSASISMMDHPIELEGTLSVSAEFKQGMLSEIYRLSATRVREASL